MTIKIDGKLVAFEVVKDVAFEVVKDVQANDLKVRGYALNGKTYKIKDGVTDSALYITINDEDGCPFEIFINSKNLEHYQWVVALTRVISAIFRKGGDCSFLIDELKSVFSPSGGYWSNKKFYPSVVAHIGSVVEEHMGLHKSTPVEALQGLGVTKTARACPKCQQRALVMQEGCEKCLECGYSKCG